MITDTIDTLPRVDLDDGRGRSENGRFDPATAT